MTRYRTIALAVGAWLLVVTGGALLVWTVISRAGEEVSGTTPVVQAGQTSDGSSGRPSPSTSTTASPSATPGAVRGTWRGASGLVIAECTGAAIRLVGAHPSSGWRMESDDSGPDRVRVEFESGDEGAKIRVEAVCADGAPSFSVESDGG